MNLPTHSYKQVSYDLRPAKQVERRMMMEALQRLAEGSFPIRDYQYTGLGSIYFVDFILLHRYLGVSKLLSAEYDLSIERRMAFNRPFGSIDVQMRPVGEVIPTLDRDLMHILWLDYDSQLTAEMLSDVVLASHHLSPGSIILATVDALAPKEREQPSECYEYYHEQAGEFFELNWTPSEFTKSKLPSTNLGLLQNAISRGVAARPDTTFSSLFKFSYADGHPMVTIGGMITTDTESRMLQACDFRDAPFVIRDPSGPPFEIMVPRLTRKERLYLDSNMPCADDWQPAQFELDPAETQSYRQIYRYYPLYAELLL